MLILTMNGPLYCLVFEDHPIGIKVAFSCIKCISLFSLHFLCAFLSTLPGPDITCHKMIPLFYFMTKDVTYLDEKKEGGFEGLMNNLPG